MTAAAGRACDERDVDRAVGRAQRDLRAALLAVRRELARERRDLRPLHGAQVVDDALGVGLLGARLREVLAGETSDPCFLGGELVSRFWHPAARALARG